MAAMLPAHASFVPMFTHLALVLAAGIFLPPLLVSWFQHVAELLGMIEANPTATRLLDLIRSGRRSRTTRPGRAQS